MAYKKTYRKKAYKRKPKQAKWKQMLKLGKGMYNDMKGPLGYAIRGVNMMKNLINTEKKYIENLTIGPIIVTSAGRIDCISLIAQGLTDITRVGNSILGASLQLRKNVVVSAVDPSQTLRMILFLDKNNANGTLPLVTDVLTTADISSMSNINNNDRFVILRDSVVTVSTSGDNKNYEKFYVDLTRLHIKFDGTAATQASAAENHIYVLLISDVAVNGPTVTVGNRIAFYDN